mgnify:CR=1 FL=1
MNRFSGIRKNSIVETHWQHGVLHRVDGPAVLFFDGDKYWYVNDKLHREDGPAIEKADGSKEWWLNGHLIKKPSALHNALGDLGIDL